MAAILAAKKFSRRHALTLVEVLMASLIFAITVAGAYSAWSASFMNIYGTSEESVCAELARSDLEKAKATGFFNLPTGALSSGTGTYTGTTSKSTNIAEWYTIAGSFISYQATGGTAPSNAAYKLVRITTDTNVTTGPGSSYTININSVRVVTTTVTQVSNSSTIYVVGTELVNSGI